MPPAVRDPHQPPPDDPSKLEDLSKRYIKVYDSATAASADGVRDKFLTDSLGPANLARVRAHARVRAVCG